MIPGFDTEFLALIDCQFILRAAGDNTSNLHTKIILDVNDY